MDAIILDFIYIIRNEAKKHKLCLRNFIVHCGKLGFIEIPATNIFYAHVILFEMIFKYDKKHLFDGIITLYKLMESNGLSFEHIFPNFPSYIWNCMNMKIEK
jgi:hypothetical protein